LDGQRKGHRLRRLSPRQVDQREAGREAPIRPRQKVGVSFLISARSASVNVRYELKAIVYALAALIRARCWKIFQLGVVAFGRP
jgi:hypothetical protein